MDQTQSSREEVEKKAKETGLPADQWQAAYDALSQVEEGLTPEEKSKVFRSASSPQNVHDWIKQLRQEYLGKVPKTVGNPLGHHV